MLAKGWGRKFIGIAMVGCVVLLAAVGVLLTGCEDASHHPIQGGTLSTKQAGGAPLKVAVQSNALSIPTVFADESGYFSEMGLEVEISTFVNGAEENKAIEKGDVDIASDGLASVYLLATGNFSWIGESDAASATVAIYMRDGSAPTLVEGELPEAPQVRGSTETLRGLTVAGPAGTMEEWAAVSYFSQFGLEAGTDFDYIGMDRAQAVESALNGVSDVFVATDADYCRVMEENGFVAVASGADATRVPFNNGYLVNNTALETRYDDLVTFLVAVYKAAETLNDNPALWNNFAYEFYRENGKPATMEDVVHESQVRKFLVPNDFDTPDYSLGSGVLDVGRFNAEIGALSEDQVVLIKQSIDTQLLEDAFNITVKGARL